MSISDSDNFSSSYDYELPAELIAQEPLESRDSSKLMVIHRETSKIEHKNFSDILDYLKSGDVLVVNESRVFPARVYGNRSTGGKVEFLFLCDNNNGTWDVLTRAKAYLAVGEILEIENGAARVEIIENRGREGKVVRILSDEPIINILNKYGEMPLPPYIQRSEVDETDKLRYQTVYASAVGSAAAPTAGLHFTDTLINEIKAKGVIVVPVVLHVGLGTFAPVYVDTLDEHKMHSERYSLSQTSAKQINDARKNGGRIIAVGTTSVRVLESVADSEGNVCAKSGETSIFIRPSYEFKVVDALITNFHLPKSTLLALVSAFWNREDILDAYKNAVTKKYRFFSYGDAVLLL